MYGLTSEGTHTRYFRAVDKAGNVSSTISRTAKIDKTAPTAGTASITGTKGSNNWYTSNVSITEVNGSDSLSGHASTTVSHSSITSNTSSTTVTVTTRDNAGNSSTRTYTVKVDKNSPSITVKSTATVTITQGTNVTSSTYFNSPTYSTSGGSMSCSPTNTSGLTVGSRSVTCTATGGNGKTASATKYITVQSASQTGSQLATNEGLPLLANGYRYRGSNPNNWVCFGSSSITNPSSCDENHKWRIIGVFDGKMKIMTNYYYGTIQSRWDSAGGTLGSNNWGRPADLKTELNGSSFYSNNTYIDATHRGYITMGTWYTGSESPKAIHTLQGFVTGERSNSTTGKIGLMSIVDFGYAGSNCTLSTMYITANACMSNNWIGYSSNQWTITPSKDTTELVWFIKSSGVVSTASANTHYSVRLVLYLDSSVKITGGSGTESLPYILSK